MGALLLALVGVLALSKRQAPQRVQAPPAPRNGTIGGTPPVNYCDLIPDAAKRADCNTKTDGSKSSVARWAVKKGGAAFCTSVGAGAVAGACGDAAAWLYDHASWHNPEAAAQYLVTEAKLSPNGPHGMRIKRMGCGPLSRPRGELVACVTEKLRAEAS